MNCTKKLFYPLLHTVNSLFFFSLSIVSRLCMYQRKNGLNFGRSECKLSSDQATCSLSMKRRFQKPNFFHFPS